jgi:molybdate transport system ATP-binding protein
MSFDIAVSRKLGDRDFCVKIESGPGITALFGPSGAGKTSALQMVAGLMKPDEGHVVVGKACLFDSNSGVDVPVHLRRAGFVFQDGRLFPHMRVSANLEYGYQARECAPDWMRPAAIAAFLGIEGLLQRWPRTLSGGEAQRVAIGRALLSNPAFLLMDEPLASLDHARRMEIAALVRRINEELGLPILYVSHDRDEVDRLADRIIEIA